MSSAPKPRPKYYDINLAHLPPPGLLSIFHRVSGSVLFFAIPVLLYLLQASFNSEAEYNQLKAFFGHPLVKFATIGAVWLYAHHFFAGLRYLLLDLHVGLEKADARRSALVVFFLGALAAAFYGGCTW